MKESRFIELLNLYIDQQISPDDAALLEEGNPAESATPAGLPADCRMPSRVHNRA